MSLHSNQTFNHPVENWVYADSVARMAATGFVSADVGKLAYQTDAATYYRLLSTAPTWFQLGSVANASSAPQSLTAATRTYLTGTALRVGKMLVLQSYRWTFAATKTAVGVAASTIDIAIGTAGTVADTARISFAKPAGTGTADEGMYVIIAVVRVVSATVGVISAELALVTNNPITSGGFLGTNRPNLVLNTVSGNFDNSGANLYAGICYTSGTAEVVTIHDVLSECLNGG
jgi:hypothetical protein